MNQNTNIDTKIMPLCWKINLHIEQKCRSQIGDVFSCFNSIQNLKGR